VTRPSGTREEGAPVEGPSDEFRATVWERAVGIQGEDAVTELLDDIAHAMAQDLETGPRDPLQDLAAAESWASVASHPMARMSAPDEPLAAQRRRLGRTGSRSAPNGQRFRPVHPTGVRGQAGGARAGHRWMGPDVLAVQGVGESAALQDLADAAQGLSGAQATDAA
jgi:hypothetical protein